MEINTPIGLYIRTVTDPIYNQVRVIQVPLGQVTAGEIAYFEEKRVEYVTLITGDKRGIITIVSIRLAFRYWFKAIFKPGAVFDDFRSNPGKLEISLWLLFFFALFYTITALVLFLVEFKPVIEPWLPVTRNRYYLYQAFWTIPWALATAMMLAGIIHTMGVVGRKNVSPGVFEDALLVTSIAWVIPSFVLMWLPETFVVPFFGRVPWPSWVDLLRLAILAPIWHIALVILGIRKTHHVSWFREAVVGLVFVAVSFGMFLPIMR